MITELEIQSIGSGLLDLSRFRLNLNGVSRESADILVTFVSLEDRSCVDSRPVLGKLFFGSFLRELELDLTISFFRAFRFELVGLVCTTDLRFGSDGRRFLPFKWQFSVSADKVEVTLLSDVTTALSLLGILLTLTVFLVKVLRGLVP